MPATGSLARVSLRKSSAGTRTARGEPTKQLLVDVLTKDIDLVAAIIDLVDNSVDGARRLRGNTSLEGLRVHLSFGEDSFAIIDNCGGISLEDAENHAFRFGPDADDPPDPYSTGQFGVGMKRALFKLGTAFTVRSTAAEDRFTLRVDVSRWLARTADWNFRLTNVRVGERNTAADRGTSILIRPLRPTITAELRRTSVRNELEEQIAERHQRSIADGLVIRVGNARLKARTPEVVCDKTIVPLVEQTTLNGASDDVDIAIVCGVHPGPPRDAGWSVFLNDRAVLLADKSAATGWGEKDEVVIPRYHNQYSRFRGFVFLRCEDTTRLPWNTTKTGLDGDDPIYRRVRTMMVDAADPVIDFLNAVKREETPEDSRYGALAESIESGELRSVFELARGPSREWTAPEASYASGPPDERVSRVYTDRPKAEIARVKRRAGVRSNKALGDYLWEYFVEREM